MKPMQRNFPRSSMQPPLGFRLFFGLVLTLILIVWAGIGFMVYTAVTDPDGAGRFAGRIIGGVISGAQEKQ